MTRISTNLTVINGCRETENRLDILPAKEYYHKEISKCITIRKKSKSVGKWTQNLLSVNVVSWVGTIDFFLFAEHVLTEGINHVYLTKVWSHSHDLQFLCKLCILKRLCKKMGISWLLLALKVQNKCSHNIYYWHFYLPIFSRPS